MAEDLNRSPLLDRNLITLVQKIIWGQKPSVISNADKQFVENAEAIHSLNKLTSKGLIAFLQSIQNYVSLSEALSFLVSTQKLGRGEEGIDALEVVRYDEKLVTKDMLDEILIMGDSMPFGWAVPIVAENGDLRHAPKPVSTSSLDFSKLRDFK